MAKHKKTKPAKPAKSAKPAKPSPKAAKPSPKPAPAPAKKSAPVKPAPTVKRTTESMEKPTKKTALRDSILKRKAPAKPIAFSLDEVRAIAKTVVAKASTTTTAAKPAKTTGGKVALAVEKPSKPNHIKAASLADILGFNPKKSTAINPADAKDVPEKFKRYYKLLIDLRNHLTAGIELHSEETLKRSSKDDAGDLSAYGQHMADAGTDTFDRDFALSLVSSEQDALSEIDAAIKRIHDGSYGLCEHTQKPIPKERLLAVPFTRFTAEAQKEIERHSHRSRTQAGIFGEMGEEGGSPKMADDGGGDE
jgi:RNA polymerase-binding transcription factor DksA